MKRSFLNVGVVLAGTAIVAVTYGLVRLAYGLVLPDVQAELHVSAAVAGGISAGASIMYCVGAVVGFVAAGRVPRTLVVLAAGTAAAGASGVAVSTSAGAFGVAAVLASTGAGLASPALVRIVARGVPARDVARSQTIVNSGTGPGLVLAGVLALVLLPDWRTAWLVSAACAVLAGAAVLWTDRGGLTTTTDRGGRSPSTDRGGRSPSTGRGVRATPTARAALPPASWFRQHLGLLVAALLLGAGSAAVWNLGRSVLVDAGAGRTASVVAWVALGVGGAAVVPTARWLDGLSVRRAWTITVAAVAVGTVGLGVGAAVLPVALVACLVFGWGYTAATGVLITWTSGLAPEYAPSGTSMLFVTLVLGQAVGAAVAGGVLEQSGAAVTMLGAAVVAAVGIPVSRVRQNGAP